MGATREQDAQRSRFRVVFTAAVVKAKKDEEIDAT
jgi:hypothetical protein